MKKLLKMVFSAWWLVVGAGLTYAVFGEEGGGTVPEETITDQCLIAFQRGVSNMSVVWTSGDGSVSNVVTGQVKGTYVPRGSENVRIICTANPGYELIGESVFDLGTVESDITFGIGNDYRFPDAVNSTVNVVYQDWDEANGRMTNAVARTDKGDWTAVGDATRVLKGCVVVTNDVTIPIAEVHGAAVLVLSSDATLTVTGIEDSAGVHVPSDASLTITVRKGSTGRVVAQGGRNSAGIGSQFTQGAGSLLGAVKIVAGTVMATGGSNAAGIGNGLAGHGGSVKIFGGAVTAVVGTGGASDIGDGASTVTSCAVSISGGIFTRPLRDAWCADRFAAFANPDPVTKPDYPYAVLPAGRVTIGKRPIHVSAAWTSDDGSVTNAIEGTSSDVPLGAEVRVVFAADDGWVLDGEAVVDLGMVTEDVVFGMGNDYRAPHAVPAGAVGYLDWDAANRGMTNATVSASEWTLVTDRTRTLNDGWYVVAYEVVLPEGSGIVVNGSAHLILCDGASLSVTGASHQAAIDVSRSGSDVNSLAIYAQVEGTGRLTAQGGEAGAGIGGGDLADGGKVTIRGGRVTAKGGMGGSDIGGGQSGAADEIAISGGIFGMPIPDAWCVERRGAFANPDTATCADYPYAILPAYKVTIGDYPHMTARWTSGDGLVTNEVEGASFRVQVWEEDVRVIFAVDDGYVLVGESEVRLGAVRRDITFGEGNDFKVPHTTSVGDTDHRYCVIDLSEGPDAAHYPVSYLDDEPEYGWPDEYRTDKLVLRRIDPGAFLMGDQAHGGEPAVRTVTLTHPYFVGVFEITQRQWELVMGTRPSYFTNETWYATRPVESVSYAGIRGAGADAGQSPETPAGEGSFLRVLQTKTGIAFDLPTEAQWEYAARSGTATDYGNGTNYRDADSAEDVNMDRVGRYVNNSGATTNDDSFVSEMVAPSNGTATVGSYAPNRWGLYDLHGNVGEICRDLHDNGYPVARGCGWRGKAPQCASSYRISVNPHVALPDYGFRIVWSLPAVEDLCGLSFDANGGSCAVTTQAVANGGSPLSLPDATKEGLYLDGWYTDPTKGGKVTSGTTVLSNQTLYAHWAEIPPQTPYCVIDLSGGPHAKQFPVTYLKGVPDDGWTDEYKTTKLVLRRIDPGTFTMGDQAHGGTTAKTVSLTKPYYIGVFEVTQRQWELVMGTRPSYFTNETWYATRPVERVGYSMIRGSGSGLAWPNGPGVDEQSFLGVLREKTGGQLAFDLPTEAQWEYAARSGMTTDYGNGKNYSGNGQTPDSNMAEVGRYAGNVRQEASDGTDEPDRICGPEDGTAAVGSYAPNGWGLYDLHGNVREWCLDRWSATLGGGDDPKGPDSGTSRVVRGGGWCDSAKACTAASRGSGDQDGDVESSFGFRLSLPLSPVQAPCELTFDANGGNCAVQKEIVELDAEEVTLPGATRKDSVSVLAREYVFTGWYTDPTTNGVRVTAFTNANQTVYAHWAAIQKESYMVINLLNGNVSYLGAVPEGGWSDEYKTTKIVLRRIVPGEFTMGDEHDKTNGPHHVTLTKPYYIGVFEITQRQWEIVAMCGMMECGRFPSWFSSARPNGVYPRPVESCTWENITSGNWKAWQDRKYFLAALRCLIKGLKGDGLDLAFNLPTEAQWEYAARAGAATDYGNGTGCGDDKLLRNALMNVLGRYRDNGGDKGSGKLVPPDDGGTANVGSYEPNGWGLYDMHGNVDELCRDYASQSKLENAKDPCYGGNSNYRVVRGGHWGSGSTGTVLSARRTRKKDDGEYKIGFRLVYEMSAESAVCTVTYDANGGRCRVSKQTAASGTKMTCLPLVTREGHVFEGWYTEKIGGSRVTESTLFAQDMTLYAHWTKPVYCVIDLSGGSKATRYPVTYLEEPPKGGWTDEYKTTKLVLRHLDPGTFRTFPPGGHRTGSLGLEVNLTQPYYLGLFEVTQRQWELVMGERPSYFKKDACYATRPVEQVSYDRIRGNNIGAQWPESISVDLGSFLGYLRGKTLLPLELPTEAQWEYAARAGTKTDYGTGADYFGEGLARDVRLDDIGRYAFNGGTNDLAVATCDTMNGTAAVGSFPPNAWGFYDLHGNVAEWCLEAYEEIVGDSVPTPEGQAAPISRVIRGGGCDDVAKDCASDARAGRRSSDVSQNVGFRLALTHDANAALARTLTYADGCGVSKQSVDRGDKPVNIPVATRPDSDFAGWDVTPNWVDADQTLTARWTKRRTYCVIDLSGGPQATHYPVTYLDAEPTGGWPDEYKTSKLVLRWINPGTFRMGERTHATDVTLTQPYYMGVFEVTQRQWELVMGDRPSFFENETCYATRPVEHFPYESLRAPWVAGSRPTRNDVGSESFLGRLSRKTGMMLDLPTEGQWEYAARSGAMTDYGNGTDCRTSGYGTDTNMNAVGRYYANGGSNVSSRADTSAGTAAVGSYRPNYWGLYDMHGNVEELCFGGAPTDSETLDPRGGLTGITVPCRGGNFNIEASACASWGRSDVSPGKKWNSDGFRIVREVPGCSPSMEVLEFDPRGGSCAVSEQYMLGFPATNFPFATREKYVLKGWMPEQIYAMSTISRIPYFATWMGGEDDPADDYVAWTVKKGLSGVDALWDAMPPKWGGRWANAFIYAFGEKLMDGSQPLLSISFDEAGEPVLTLAPRDPEHPNFCATVIGARDLREFDPEHRGWDLPYPPQNPFPLDTEDGLTWRLPGRIGRFFRVKMTDEKTK